MSPDVYGREGALLAAMTDWKTDAIVIGGYAASTLSIPRYSVDLDLVLRRSDLDAARAHLARLDLHKVSQRGDIEQNYGGSWERWERRADGITIDLLVDSVTDRDFRIPLPYSELRKDATRIELVGIRGKGPPMWVASREALIFLKVQPMRSRDIGDIACLAAMGWDSRRLKTLLARLVQTRPDLLRERLLTFARMLGDFKESAEQALGPRVPGPAKNRTTVLNAARRLHDEIARALPAPSGTDKSTSAS